MPQVTCGNCGKKIYRKASALKRNGASFCSHACHALVKRTGGSVTCAWCDRSFYKSPSQRGNEADLCSARCRNLWLGRRNIRVLNKPGHSKGHKAPHLTKMNRERNPLCRISKNQRLTSSKVYRLMAEEWLGRKLLKGEVVHHINGDRADNRPENFMVMTAKEHKWLHMRIALRRYAKGGDAQCQKKQPSPVVLLS